MSKAKKGELGREWCGTSNECYGKEGREAEKRTLELIRKNAKAGDLSPRFHPLKGRALG